MRAEDPPLSPWRVIAVQAAVGVAVALLALLLTGRQEVAWSLLYGAATVVVPGALMARGMTSRLSSMSPGASAVSFMLWEMVKIGVSVAMLMLAPKLVQPLSWPALLVAPGAVHEGVLAGAAVARPRERDKTGTSDTHGSRRHASTRPPPVNTSSTTCSICRTSKQTAVVDFSVFNLDSHLLRRRCWACWAAGCCGVAARKATSGVPGRFQAAVEILVEMVDSQAKGIVHNAKAASSWRRWR